MPITVMVNVLLDVLLQMDYIYYIQSSVYWYDYSYCNITVVHNLYSKLFHTDMQHLLPLIHMYIQDSIRLTTCVLHKQVPKWQLHVS